MLLRRGDRGPAVAGIREALASLQLLPPVHGVDPDAAAFGTEIGTEIDTEFDIEFDAAIDGAIRTFQQQRGLIVDGMVGPVTIRSLTDARWKLGDRPLTYTLSAMMTGDDVMALQTRLAEMGYNTGRPDGIFGPLTDGCVRDFQRHRGLTEDGVFGPATHRELTRIGRMVTGGRPHYLREYQMLRQAGPRLHGKRIVIDPGHGGADLGWHGHGVNAADLTYDIARRLQSRMVTAGMTVSLTREQGENPSPEERAAFANTINADLVLSLHIDSSASPQACGVATFHFGTDSGATSTVGETLAGLVQRELVARTQFSDCRVHHRPWDILRLTKMPAIQVEIGYLSNPQERERLTNADFRNVIADGLLVAVKRLYLDGHDDPHTGTFSFSDLLAHERMIRDSA